MTDFRPLSDQTVFLRRAAVLLRNGRATYLDCVTKEFLMGVDSAAQDIDFRLEEFYGP
jgi:hypothetical protein